MIVNLECKSKPSKLIYFSRSEINAGIFLSQKSVFPKTCFHFQNGFRMSFHFQNVVLFPNMLSFSKCEWFCECCSSFFPKNTIVVRQKSEHSLQICTIVPRSYATPSSNAMLFWIGSKKTLVKLFSPQLCYFFLPVTLFFFLFPPVTLFSSVTGGKK